MKSIKLLLIADTYAHLFPFSFFRLLVPHGLNILQAPRTHIRGMRQKDQLIAFTRLHANTA